MNALFTETTELSFDDCGEIDFWGDDAMNGRFSL